MHCNLQKANIATNRELEKRSGFVDNCPNILAFYESEEGQREFAAWKRQREFKDNQDGTGDEVTR